MVSRAAVLGRLLSLVNADRAFLRLQRTIFCHGYIRAVMYHDTPDVYSGNLRSHFAFYEKHFCPVSQSDLSDFLRTNSWPKSKPGIMVCFDDGLRSNYDVAYRMLEEYGLLGWFFIPAGFIDLDAGQSEKWAGEHSIIQQQRYADGRVAMSWNEIRELHSKGHVIGSHTQTHHRMVRTTHFGQMKEEIALAKAISEEKLGHPITSFAWVGGEEWTYNASALKMIQDAGYEYCFTSLLGPITSKSNPLMLHRTGVEARAGLDVVKLQLSGIVDVLVSFRRSRVERSLFP